MHCPIHGLLSKGARTTRGTHTRVSERRTEPCARQTRRGARHPGRRALAGRAPMMIKLFDAHVALGAVRRARWAVDTTRAAPLERHYHPVYLNAAWRVCTRLGLGIVHVAIAARGTHGWR